MLELFSYGIVFHILVFLLFYFFVVLLPTLILSNSISKINKFKRIDIISENEEQYLCSENLIVLKKWFNDDNNMFICPYGYFIPIYNINDDIVAFTFINF